MVAPACTIRRIAARLAALAVLLTIAPMPVLAGGVCQDAGDRSMPADAGAGNEAGPQGPVTLRVGEQSSATFQAYGGGALVIRPPAPADAGDPGSAVAASVQPQIIYAPGTPPRTSGRPVVRTLAGAGPETAAIRSAPAGAGARPAPAIIQPAIVYAPGARPRPASPGPGAADPIAIGQLQLSSEDCDALARVAYAEAANQGPDGLAAVAYTILNRVASGRFQNSVQAVIDAPDQFEPVARAGGWRRLPPLSPGLQAQFDLLLAAMLSGEIPDPTRGALYFQNRAVVAARAAAGLVPPSLVDFGGQPAIAEVRDHSFYGDPAARAAAPGWSAPP